MALGSRQVGSSLVEQSPSAFVSMPGEVGESDDLDPLDVTLAGDASDVGINIADVGSRRVGKSAANAEHGAKAKHVIGSGA